MVQDSKGTQLERIFVNVDTWMVELIGPFLKHKQEELSSLLIALRAGDFEEVEEMGHAVKGTAAVYGFPGMTRIGQSIERAAAERQIEELEKLADELSEYLIRVEVVYK